jgi:4a-hydroxytetrahydrobiopterin dehydratase
MDLLPSKHCVPCSGETKPLEHKMIIEKLAELHPEWKLAKDHKSIYKNFKLKNFYQTMAFVNAIAWMTNIENHHPDLEMGYNHCLIRYTTHAINGLSINDFICAANLSIV